MAKYGRGLICIPMTGERLDELGIPMMVERATSSQFGTPFTVSVEARTGVTTGISAADRARTVQVLIDPKSTKDDYVDAGPPVPAARPRRRRARARRARPRRPWTWRSSRGSTRPACSARSCARTARWRACPTCKRFAQRHHLKIISVEQLIAYRQRHEKLVERVAETVIPTPLRHLARHRLQEHDRRGRARGAGHGRHHANRAGPGARAQPVRHRRRLPQHALRLRRAAGEGDAAHRRRRARRHRLHAPGGARHRLPQQAARLRAAGRRPRHGRGERGARLRGRPPRLRHRHADPRRPGADAGAAADEQPARSAPASKATACRWSSACRSSSQPNEFNARYLETKRDKLGHRFDDDPMDAFTHAPSWSLCPKTSDGGLRSPSWCRGSTR